MTRRLRAEGGFTITEMLVGMIVLAIILSGFMQVLMSTSKTSNRVEEQALLQNDVRASIDRLTTDLRSATDVHDSSPVVAVGPTTLTFDSPDRGTPFHLRRISYRLNGATLERSTLTSVNTGSWPWTWPMATPQWTPELGSIKNSSVFTFYDDMGAVTTTASAVHAVRVTLTVAPHQTQAASSTYSALVTIRTLQ
jgi:prepilin-type N-terminal cleavage/methylation domain-containing protein